MARNVLVVGEFSHDPSVYTYASSFVRAFKSLGYAVQQLNTKSSYLPGISKNYYSMNRFERYASVYMMNKALEKFVKNNDFDLIFFLKPDVIKPATLKNIRNYASRLIAFYPDNPFVLWNGNSNADVLSGLPLFDEYLIWSLGLIDPLYAAGAQKVSYFPFGFDAHYLNQDEGSAEPVFDACFIGTWEPDRAWWLEELIKRRPALRLGIWGSLWDESLAKDSPLRPFLQGPARYGKEMMHVFRSSAIVLNFIRQQNRGSHNMRTLEVPACNAFLLTERTYEQAEYLFTEGESVACFATPDELVEKIDYFLNNKEVADRITQAGFEHVQQYELTHLLEKFLMSEKDVINKTKDRYFVASSI